ncbi:Dehydroquinate synthase-like protein [Aspergillus affinis]|uniref:Dehydroquinate synthase-like protein n=1 Tax=Aspergillus affinis TaxID=1070780 RepID=UPI0022FE08E5|nr:Dehydroquinate synthase-like protein [Aspergillus affinis]KAI9035936.1 Dehydroquinate synthase-like protein [Aspergillus affinis]
MMTSNISEEPTGNILPITPGHWIPGALPKHIYYGSGCVAENLLSCLAPLCRVFIITNNSLSKSTLISQLERLLGSHHAGTISLIKQHAPIEDIEEALSTILSTTYSLIPSPTITLLISLGGGSPIDAAKIISYKHHSATGSFLPHIAIPTTLSGAECTPGGGYTITMALQAPPNSTQERAQVKIKKGILDKNLAITTIFYDPTYAAHTPRDLWLSSGIRALDHATECMYHPLASEVPWKALALFSFGELFTCLRLVAVAPSHVQDENLTLRLMLAAYASSGLKGSGIGGMGLSHRLGHAIGSFYGIPHGITSCMTLGEVVKVKAREKACVKHIARLVDLAGGVRTGDDYPDAVEVGEKILSLVNFYRVLEDGTNTQYRLSVIESLIPPHAEGPVFHFHEMHDEGFYVTVTSPPQPPSIPQAPFMPFFANSKEKKGQIRFHTPGRPPIDASAGDFIVIPIRLPHKFSNPFDEEAVFVNTITPGFFVRYFECLEELIGEGVRLTEAVNREALRRFATVTLGREDVENIERIEGMEKREGENT